MARDGTRQDPRPPKLPRLPHNARIRKRPLLHPAIPSPYTNSTHEKVVYISAKTPFVAAVKRVRKLLSLIDKRTTKDIDLLGGKSSDQANVQALAKREERPEAVFLKATGKAIEKALGLALYFQGQDDVAVRLTTGAVGAVDDIVQEEGDNGRGVEEELPESRMRKASTLEVAISLRR